VLAGRRVVLGVCGGIAAYKAVEICRRLTDAGALVSPVLTEAATRFVGPLTFSALAAEPAALSLFEAPELPGGAGGHPVPHIRLAQMADAVVVAPATARAIGSYAAGIASDLLTSVLIATRAPVLVCPAMHTEMWEHPAVQDNIRLLKRRGVHVLEPADGRLAGGDSGPGRLPEAEEVVFALARALGAPSPPADAAAPAQPTAGPGREPGPLRGARAVVSAGGTREPLDAVRYVGNRSSGKQGYAVAAVLAARGADVTLVTSSDLPAPPGVVAVSVSTAAEMADAVLRAAADAQVVVMVAAVADYRPEAPVEGKMKKTGRALSLRLVPTRDILAELGARRAPGQVLVGFAAETAGGAELVRLARQKLNAKQVDLVVANDVSAPGGGFGSDRNAAVIVSGGSASDLGLADKAAVAAKVADAIEQLLATTPGRTSEPGEQA
jgi:phosphopantothenoylcysteine decarboxylase / phosphopantothenate---cysteine ligase